MDIPTPRFRLERGGYAVEDVDAFLNQFFSVLSKNPRALTGTGLRGVKFRSIPARPGYSPAQVDAWLSTVAAEVDRGQGRTIDETSVVTPRSPSAPSPAPYDELERGFDLPSELHAAPSLSTGPVDPATDPGRNAVKELPATPPWLSLTILIVLLSVMTYLTYAYFR